ncbi:MAG TPA: hypothetical protein VK176_15015 [Phycisphaerales bacterium]|nr:hypothetical protein [Phycisphaerales bacterium]
MTGHQPSSHRQRQDQNPHAASGKADAAAHAGPGIPRLPDGSVVDRRTIPDRRALADKADGGEISGLERRRGPGRRLSDFQRSAEEGELTPEQFLFIIAIDEFKKGNGKTFPSWTDVLEVIRLLGYRKTQPSELNLLRAEDWNEPHDAPARVRPSRWQERFRSDEHRDAA